ncbi:hypothetical protein, partial [Sulfitobacter sp. HI0076]|uniref:hypothetical protein n=1 Tax=Sulfitobacter sp. HI0076 TaxID=1822251 RepID=UPI001F2E625F
MSLMRRESDAGALRREGRLDPRNKLRDSLPGFSRYPTFPDTCEIRLWSDHNIIRLRSDHQSLIRGGKEDSQVRGFRAFDSPLDSHGLNLIIAIAQT